MRLLQLIIGVIFLFYKVGSQRSFVIDYENNQFLKDGQPYRYISGSLHYFRIPKNYWQDRLDKVKAAGLNTIQTYIDWSQHEPEPGVFNFNGNLDVVEFLTLVNNTGLNAILRPGPYIDSERDFGGLPYWLFRENPDMVIRSSDPTYLSFVDRYFTVLFGYIKPLLYSNGGPIISVQIENEYGSYYTCDMDYLTHLRDFTRDSLGNDIILFTTDGAGAGYLECGKIPDVYATVDFGPGSNVDNAFAAQRQFEPQGPLVNSEYYTGWLDHWGTPHEHVNIDSVEFTLARMLDKNASVNMYMFHGGTSFGFTAGANAGSTYQVCPTSYDYDAPLSEAGDTSNQYFGIREVLSNYVTIPDDPIPPNTTKSAYGTILLQQVGTLFDLLPQLLPSPPITAEFPLTFEALGQGYGFVLYETVITADYDSSVLGVTEIRDRGYVFVDHVFVGILSREDQIAEITVTILANQLLSIFVENQGRICYGPYMESDIKGIYTDVTLDGNVLTNWTMYSVPLNNTDAINFPVKILLANDTDTMPVFYTGELTLPEDVTEPQDTFLKPLGWQKGVAFINGFNLGRYWPTRGPQITLFVPNSLLLPYPQTNKIILFEQERAPSEATIEFVDKAEIDAPTSNTNFI